MMKPVSGNSLPLSPAQQAALEGATPQVTAKSAITAPGKAALGDGAVVPPSSPPAGGPGVVYNFNLEHEDTHGGEEGPQPDIETVPPTSPMPPSPVEIVGGANRLNYGIAAIKANAALIDGAVVPSGGAAPPFAKAVALEHEPKHVKEGGVLVDPVLKPFPTGSPTPPPPTTAGFNVGQFVLDKIQAALEGVNEGPQLKSNVSKNSHDTSTANIGKI